MTGLQVSTAGHLRLRDITLSRIPHLRSFVNDALLDVLYFMSPAYHQVPREIFILSSCTVLESANPHLSKPHLNLSIVNQLTPHSSLSPHHHLPLPPPPLPGDS